jgi:hypothetical protein
VLSVVEIERFVTAITTGSVMGWSERQSVGGNQAAVNGRE